MVAVRLVTVATAEVMALTVSVIYDALALGGVSLLNVCVYCCLPFLAAVNLIRFCFMFILFLC